MWNMFNYKVLNFKEEATEIMIGIRDLHDYILFYLLLIIIFVTYLLIYVSYKNNSHKSLDLNHNSFLEFIWTITPAIILLLIAIPSFKLLYSIDEVLNPLITLKIIGNQWYWDYNIFDINISSYLKEDYKLFKLLETDNPIYLPILTPIRLIVTANDVNHSWTIPNFGIKIDAIPGRLNQGLLYILKKGIYFGQCSELCGLGHPNMPIEIRGVDNLTFEYWISSNK